MIKAEGEELKMPDFFEPAGKKLHDGMPELDAKERQQINQLTTFLTGAAESEYFPERYF